MKETAYGNLEVTLKRSGIFSDDQEKCHAESFEVSYGFLKFAALIYLEFSILK